MVASNYIIRVLIAVLLLVAAAGTAPGRIIYVDDDAAAGGSGQSWSSAYRAVQDALADANAAGTHVEIRVAQGTYKPFYPPAGAEITEGHRGQSFHVAGDVVVRGGYAGPGQAVADLRDPQRYPTILSGDLLGNDVHVLDPNELLTHESRRDNVFHVVQTYDAAGACVLDGLHIRDGHANGVAATEQDGGGLYNASTHLQVVDCTFTWNAGMNGGAMYTSRKAPLIERCIFRYNAAAYGGAIYNERSDLSCLYCRFENNASIAAGGAMLNDYSKPTIMNCTFVANGAGGYCSFDDFVEFVNTWGTPLRIVHAGGRDGGAVYNRGASPTIINCMFARNTAGNAGAAVFNRGDYRRMTYPLSYFYWSPTHPRISQCTFAGNAALHGDAVFNYWSWLSLSGSVFWSNPHTRKWVNYDDDSRFSPEAYCVAQDVWPNPGDMLWPSPLTADGHLHSASFPCIDAGDPNFAVDVNTLYDVDGERRDDDHAGHAVDIGADEFIDSDGNGLPDWWESFYFTQHNARGAYVDTDGDGLLNIEEYELFASRPDKPALHVGQSATDLASPKGTPAHPFGTIQEALDTAETGDTLLIHPGLYTGEGNVDLNFWRKSLCLRGLEGPDATIIDCQRRARVIDVNSTYGARILLEGFEIVDSVGDLSSAIRMESCQFVLRDCLLRNTGQEKTGGLSGTLSDVLLDGVTMVGNPNATNLRTPYMGTLLLTNVTVQDTWRLGSGSLWLAATCFQGPGTIELGPKTELRLVGDAVEDGPCILRTNVRGPGRIYIIVGQQLIIDTDAVVDLSGVQDCPPDPQVGGLILVEGSLVVRGSGTLQSTNVRVNLMDINTPNDVQYNNIILQEASAGFGGEFFVAESAIIRCNNITSEGDRYLDLDPDPNIPENRRPVIEGNRISVLIREGKLGRQGTLLELRAKDFDCLPPCPSGAYPVGRELDFSHVRADNWLLDHLELEADAKLSLTNRQGFRFQDLNDPTEETVYVRDLVMGPNAVLNTALQRLYYERLTDPNGKELQHDLQHPYDPMDNGARFADIPLLGFSLGIIAMDDPMEFDIRVRKRLRPRGVKDSSSRGLIERLEGHPDIPAGHKGVMVMDTGMVSSIAAKGAFARAGDEDITVEFEYMFREGADPDTELIVYLSDHPDVSTDYKKPYGSSRPEVSTDYNDAYEVARITLPEPNRPGSPKSGFALFSGTFAKGKLNFTRGTYVELELRGSGTCCWIDNWDPRIRCTMLCRDYDGSTEVDMTDYLLIWAEYGLTDPSHVNKGCLDLLTDRIVDLGDADAWETCDRAGVRSNCPPRGIDSRDHMTTVASRRAAAMASSASASGASATGPLLVMAKGGVYNGYPTRDNYLCRVDSDHQQVGSELHPGMGRLVTDANGNVYRVDPVQGLVWLKNGDVPVVPPQKRARYGDREVTIGFHEADDAVLSDAVFHPDDPNIVYIVPVRVFLDAYTSYMTAAKLDIDANDDGRRGDVSILRLYDPNALSSHVASDPNKTLDIFPEPDYYHPREVELDNEGRNLLVLSVCPTNGNNWVLAYDAQSSDRDGSQEDPKARPLSISDPGLGIPDSFTPGSMLASSAGDCLYLTSAQRSTSDANEGNAPSDLQARLYCLAMTRTTERMVSSLSYVRTILIDCNKPPESKWERTANLCTGQHMAAITSLAEAPDGTFYAIGYTAPVFRKDAVFPDSDDLGEYGGGWFMTPVLATIPAPGTQARYQAKDISRWNPKASLALPLSMVWVGSGGPVIGSGPMTSPGPLNPDRDHMVLLAGQWLDP